MRVALMVALLALAGCLEPSAPASDDLRTTVASHLRAYVERDVEGVLEHQADPWVDLGGGNCGSEPLESCDAANVTREESRAMLEQTFASEEYRAMVDGKRVEDLFDLVAMRDEDARARFAEQGFETWFPLQSDDRAVHVPPREGSPFHDGFFRAYRSVNGTWLAVAGD